MFSAGCSVVVGDHLCVQYYGEERALKIVCITPLETPQIPASLSPIQENLSQQLSTLTLSHSTPPTPHTSHTVYKITLKTELVIQSKTQSSTEVSLCVYLCLKSVIE